MLIPMRAIMAVSLVLNRDFFGGQNHVNWNAFGGGNDSAVGV